MSLLLLERARQGDPITRYTDGAICGAAAVPSGLIPDRTPRPGEQYRFHFDMTKCIGCRCCEVACSEQNGTPTDLGWRRVGEIEGGAYPYTHRFYLSMGCNHCVEAACLTGCPVDAYSHDPATGLVLHNADACIGCQYCTWNCPYGAPQYNPERGVVGKCDMCHNRLSEGLEPACVNACPKGAIEIEIVDSEEWRLNHEAADSPGLPCSEHTISTTRITLPHDLGPELEKTDTAHVRAERPHWPLVFMLTLTQLSVGAFYGLAGYALHSGVSNALAAMAALMVAALALGTSTLHLGRPIHAYRALRMWRRSWLSREVLLFSLFAGSASAFAGAVWLGSVQAVRWTAIPTVAFGLAGVTASAFIYLVPARPAWNNWHTPIEFHLTALVLGPAFLRTLGVGVSGEVIAGAAALALINQLLKLLHLMRSDEFEMRASARLLARKLETLFIARLALLLVGGIALSLAGFPLLAFVAAFSGELIGRYVFFVSVVPRNMALPWLSQRKHAA